MTTKAIRAVRVDTILATAILWHHGITARDAASIARAFLRSHKGQMGGGATATVSVAIDGGCWHRVAQVGNRR